MGHYKDPRWRGKQNQSHIDTIKRTHNKRKIKTGTLNTDNFIRKPSVVPVVKYISGRMITDLPVDSAIISNLKNKGYEKPTEIQDRTIEAILNGRNLMGLAQTGTGKTGAYLIPLIHNFLRRDAKSNVLVVSPTRELALQIDKEFRSIAFGLKLFSTCLIGGTSVRVDIEHLRRPGQIVIGTPGRIADMVRQGALNPNRYSILVLDEFDRLLDMGFSAEINRLVEDMSNRSQTILFSATEDKSQKTIIRSLMTDPVEVRVRDENISADNIEQDIITVKDGEKKIDILLNMIKDQSFEKVLIFADTKRGVSRICRDIRRAGIPADEIHGDKSQNYRIKALEAFRNRKIKVLVATDVAARGLDIANVSHVINFQAPKDIESYIHRIGRTGRAGATGKALTFVN
ncbi:MAG: DEAD/DEAH box helicase [Bacteroidales bacterium]|jgi:ATP-dependent RNA helicase RhlE|nr:DEAD/DEAH box helicase [Bacteroidales bacterium]